MTNSLLFIAHCSCLFVHVFLVLFVEEKDDEWQLTKAGVKKLKVSELRDELSKRGLDTNGNKSALSERLENSLPV